MKSSINKFVKGLVQDVNDINQSKDSYNDSMGGSLIYNDDGNYDWVVRNGNKFSFTLTPNNGAITDKYTPIGAIGNTDIKVIFSVDEVNGFSEIGVFAADSEGVGSYKTLYNDITDISQPAIPVPILNFKSTNQIEARFLYENDETIRVYWVDGIKSDSNPPRVFTFRFEDLNPNGKANVQNYFPVTTSAHSINVQALFNPGIIKFRRTITGTLLSGAYQYTYRLITKDGYATPWVTPSRRLFLTTDQVNQTDWNLYEMEGSGVASPKGNLIQIKGIDERYEKIEVAYIYCQTDLQVSETTIFVKRPISGDTMDFSHISMTGTPIVAESIASQFAGIRAAKTLDAKDATLYYGNIIEGLSFLTDAEKDAIVSGVDIRPIFKKMRSDEVSPDVQSIPLTHQFPKSQSSPAVAGFKKQLHNQAGGVEDYDLQNDYVNYKGTQVDKEFSGYWRGETYRFGLQIFDNIGLPIFVIHLGDFKTPEQTTLNFSWQRLRSDGVTIDTGGNSLLEYPWATDNYGSIAGNDLWFEDGSDPIQFISKIRIMGIEIDGIDLSAVSNKISGYSIVRTDLDRTILAQGLVLPCISDTDGAGGNELTRPLHNVSQRWLNATNNNSDPAQIKSNNYYDHHSGNQFGMRANISAFYAPDYDFDQLFIPTVQTGDYLNIVSSSYSFTNQDPSRIGTDGDRNYFNYYRTWTGPTNRGGQHTITKQYLSKNDYHFSSSSPYPRYQNKALIEQSISMSIGEKKLYDTINNRSLDSNTHFQYIEGLNNDEGFAIGDSADAFFKGKEKPLVYYVHGNYDPTFGAGGALNWSALFFQNEYPTTIFGGTQYPHGGLLANYVRPNPAPYGGVTEISLQKSIFYSTGHFQPINNPAFATPANDIYDGVEVWGGDCYLDYHAFLRTYPRYWGTGRSNGYSAAGSDKLETDVAHGIVMPYESILNHSMRQAPSAQNPMYPEVGALPEQNIDPQSNIETFNIWDNGLYYENSSDKLVEEFELNGVMLQRELLKFFLSEPEGFNLITKYPVRWRYTGDKIYGDDIDYWRSFLSFDFKDINGIYGQITSSSYFFNQIYSFQESAFGRLRASDRAVLNTTVGGLTTGTGVKLDGVDYISTKYGNQHQFSLVNSGKSLYWVDVDKRKAMRFAGDGRTSLSDVRGLHSHLKGELGFFYNKDSPASGEVEGGICGVFDYENNHVFWTFVRDNYLRKNNVMYIDSENNMSTDYYSNNSTIFVDWFGPSTAGDGIVFPETEFINFKNKSVVYYVANKVGANPIDISTATANPPATNSIAVVNPGEYWEIKRDVNTQAWTASQVSLEDITPFKATLCYNEDLNSFMGFFAFKPSFYWDHKNLVYSHDKDITGIGNDYYVHNLNPNKSRYYNQNYKSYISLDVNEDESASKVFDSIRFNFNEQGSKDYTRFLFNTEKQYNYYDVQSDTRLKYVEDSMRMPVRRFDQGDRTRGKWVNFIFEFKNNDNIAVKLFNLITNYRISNRF